MCVDVCAFVAPANSICRPGNHILTQLKRPELAALMRLINKGGDGGTVHMWSIKSDANPTCLVLIFRSNGAFFVHKQNEATLLYQIQNI